MVAAFMSAGDALVNVHTVVFAVNVLQIKPLLAFAVVAPEGVYTLPVIWTLVLSRHTLINIHTGFPIRTELQTSRGTETADLPLNLLTAVLTVSQSTRPGVCTGAVRHEHISIQTVAHVAAKRVHAAVLARPRLQTTFIQILTAGLSAVPWKALALIGADTLSMLAA